MKREPGTVHVSHMSSGSKNSGNVPWKVKITQFREIRTGGKNLLKMWLKASMSAMHQIKPSSLWTGKRENSP